MMRIRLGLLVLAATLTASVHAHDYKAGSLHLIHPTTSSTTSGQDAVGVYLVIENVSAMPDRLVSASSEIAKEASLHAMNQASHNMHAASGLEIPAKGRIELTESGSHVMLMRLDRRLKAGERFPLRLVFEKAGAVLVDVLVVGTTDVGGSHSAH